MSKEFARAFYNSTAWKTCRESYKHKAAYLCERCGAPGEIVHHKRRVSPETIEDPEVLLSFDNLELLCRDCHAAEHVDDIEQGKTERRKRRKKPYEERYFFGDNGEVILIAPLSNQSER